jgi:hypothetical protein
MRRTLALRMIALALFFIFIAAAYMERQSGRITYFFFAALAVFSSIGISFFQRKN